MKILQVLLAPQVGGAETLVSSLEEAWAAEGVESMTTFLDQESGASRSRISRAKNLLRAVKAFDPDCIVAHTAIPNIYSRILTSRRLPVVAVLHSSADDYRSLLWRILERFIRAYRSEPVVAVSSVALEVYARRFGQSGIRLIPNGSRDPGLRPSYRDRPAKVVTVARVAPVKNPALWKTVANSFTHVTFDWWGTPNSDLEMAQLIEGHGTSNSGRFMGPTDDVAVVLNAADLMFHPSDRESVGLSVVEAAMNGLPVVCSEAVAGAVGTDLVAETFVPGDAVSAYEAVKRVLENYSRFSAEGPRRRENALSKYGIASCASSYIALLERQLEIIRCS